MTSRRSFLRGLLALPAAPLAAAGIPAQPDLSRAVQFNGPSTFGGTPDLRYTEFPGPWLVECEGFSFKNAVYRPAIGHTMSVIQDGVELTGKVLSVTLLE